MKFLKYLLLIGVLGLATGCGGGGTSGATTLVSSGLKLLLEFSKGGDVIPVVKDYGDAGFKNVDTKEEVSEANTLLRGSSVNSFSEIESLLREGGILSEVPKDAGVTFSFRGKEYGTVTSPYTGRVWLDRNLGAKQVCTAMNDFKCIGDFYQWGRGADGHEKVLGKFLHPSTKVKDSDFTNVPADSFTSNSKVYVTPINIDNRVDDFDINRPYPFNGDWVKKGFDDDGKKRQAYWSRTDGSSVCPAEFRVPTAEELHTEVNTAEKKATDRLYYVLIDMFLKIPSTGGRGNARKRYVEFIRGYTGIWTTSTHTLPYYAENDDENFDAGMVTTLSVDSRRLSDWINAADEATIRCIKD